VREYGVCSCERGKEGEREGGGWLGWGRERDRKRERKRER